jgi:hypothetical protein
MFETISKPAVSRSAARSAINASTIIVIARRSVACSLTNVVVVVARRAVRVADAVVLKNCEQPANEKRTAENLLAS